MFVIIGLGNPGKKYSCTRHNVGFMVLDQLEKVYGIGGWKKKFQGEISEAIIENQKVLFFKPQTYMNLSGHAVAELVNFYKLSASQLIIIYDDLDLKSLNIKVRDKGGSGGHNGIKNILQFLSEDFIRVRIGIGHPGDRERVSGYVLAPITKVEMESYKKLGESICDHISLLLTGSKSLFIEKIKKDQNN